MSDRAPAPRWLRLAPLVVMAALAIALIASGELRRLSIGDLSSHRLALEAAVRAHPLSSPAGYVGLFVLVIVACLPGPSVMSLAGGLLFGPVLGGALSLASIVAGSTVVFLACRTAFGDWAARRGGSMAARIEAGFARNAFAYLLALRLFPVAPVFVVNIASGLARIRLGVFVAATLLGSAPASFIFASLGAGLNEAVARRAPIDASLFARPGVALPLAALALLSLAAPLWRLWRAGRR